MRKELLDKLIKISDEEKMILNGESLKREIYTTQTGFDIDSEKLLSLGKFITVRTHTRFIDFPVHSHNYIEIMYVCSGKIVHTINGKDLSMNAGDILFMNQHVKHGIKKADMNDIGINFIILPEFFDLPLLMLKKDKNNILAEFLIDALRIDTIRPQYLHFKTNNAIENLMENIISSILSGNKNEENINQITMGLIFLHLLNNIDNIGSDSMQGYHDIVVDTVLSYIDKNYKDANLTELSQSMNQSLPNLSKIIKKRTGFTFQEHLQRKRFQQAVAFLIDTKMTVAEIMNTVGYENSSYFYKTFRKKYGMSPREYRAEHKNDELLRV